MKRSSPDGAGSQAEFERQIAAGVIEPLYLFDGPELYLRDQALQRLTAAAVDPGLLDFNRTTVSVATGSLEEALGLARQYPMMSPRRLIIVSDFESISDERQLDQLKEYLSQPVGTTVLVFITTGMDNRRSIATMLRKSCRVVQFNAPDDQQTTMWVRDYVTRQGGTIDAATAAWLVATVGVDLTHLANELDKLINYVGHVGTPAGRPFVITRHEIDLLVRHSREHSNFELTDAVIAGDRARALRLLDRLYANTDESAQSLSLMIIGAIASNYRRLLIAKDLMRLDRPNSEVAQAVGMSPYAVTHLNEKARRLSNQRLIDGMEKIARADLGLKSSLATPKMLLELLVCELTGPAPVK